MFTGIIETTAKVQSITAQKGNLIFELNGANFLKTLKIDQSIAHNGCCLSVSDITDNSYCVTAIQETLEKTNLSEWNVGTIVNLERCLSINARIDGHIVQGHIDCIAICENIEDQNGSFKFTFSHESDHFTIEKGSIAVNGVSLTVLDSTRHSFAVCIIPLTYEITNFHTINVGDKVNIEFDMMGKYVAQWMHHWSKASHKTIK